MSKLTVKGDVAGTGVFTVASPNSNTDRVLTLPDESGTVLTNASSLASSNLAGPIPATNFPSGSVIAVSTVRNGTRTSMPSSNNYIAFSGTFTKVRSDSVIIATATVLGNGFSSGNSGVGLRLDTTWDFGSGYQYDGAWTAAHQTTIVIGTGSWSGISSGTHTMGWGWLPVDGTAQRPFDFLNPNTASGDPRNQQMISSIIIYEIAA